MRSTSVFVVSALLLLATFAEGRAVDQVDRKKHTSKTKTKTKTKHHHSSTDTPAPTPTSTPPTGGSGGGHGGSGSFDSSLFFPIPFKKAFTTLPKDIVKGSNVAFVDTSLDALAASHISKGVTQDVVDGAAGAPSGVKAFHAKYPKGSFNPSGTPRGGFGFYVGDPQGADFSYESAKEILFSYAVWFPADFDWVKGGKIPGAYGGSTADDAYGCSGGREEGRDKCFSLRMMWRGNGAGEVYAYVPKVKENDDAFAALPGSVPDKKYGWSVARGAFSFKAGEWTVLAERVKLNAVGQADGELELFVNGESKIKASGLIISQNKDTAFRGGHFQTFFGGSNNTWATPKDTETYFAGVSAAIIA